MGTPAFAERSLERLYADGHDIACVFTQPDKPRSRGMHVTSCPVKELAVLHGTPVYSPLTLKDGAAADALLKHDCELIAVVAYGRILPRDILELPPYGAINVHGSLLPKYRGAAPVQWAVLNGDKETGVTTQFISEELDSGDILFTKKTAIGEDETSGELFERLSYLSAELLSETIDAVSRGEAVPVPQDVSKVSYAPMLTKEMSPIDWTETADRIKRKVCGLNPWPVATTRLGGTLYRVFRAGIGEKQENACEERKHAMRPGEIVSAGKQGIEVACSDGTVIIKELQVSGGKRMTAGEYLRGHRI